MLSDNPCALNEFLVGDDPRVLLEQLAQALNVVVFGDLSDSCVLALFNKVRTSLALGCHWGANACR